MHFPIPQHGLKEFFPCISNPLALDLLSKFLALDPKNRITAKEALDHPFFQPLTKEQEIILLKYKVFPPYTKE